jgi:hypothetical protein
MCEIVSRSAAKSQFAFAILLQYRGEFLRLSSSPTNRGIAVAYGFSLDAEPF